MNPLTRVVDLCAGLTVGIVTACAVIDRLDDTHPLCPLCRTAQAAARVSVRVQAWWRRSEVERGNTRRHLSALAQNVSDRAATWTVLS